MATINITISDGLLDDLLALYQARYKNDETFNTTAKKTEYIGKVMTYEMQELLKQYKREVAVVQTNQEIEASPDFIKTEFEAEQEAKALAMQPKVNKG